MEEGLETEKWGWMKTKTAIMGELKKMGTIGAPMVATVVLHYLLQVVSMMMVGHLNQLSLSCVAIVTSLTNVSRFDLLSGKGLNTWKKRMQQRKLMFGRPSGTDGSDYSYRMVVDSRYQLVAKGKKRLSVLFIVEALLLLIGVVFAFLPGTKGDTQNKIPFYSVIGSVVLLIIAEIGRRRSRPSLLRLYAVLSSLLMLLLTASLANQHSLLKAIQYFSSRGTAKFDVNDSSSFQICLLVYILILSLFKISTIKAVIFLLFNMTPPKKTS